MSSAFLLRSLRVRTRPLVRRGRRCGVLEGEHRSRGGGDAGCCMRPAGVERAGVARLGGEDAGRQLPTTEKAFILEEMGLVVVIVVVSVAERGVRERRHAVVDEAVVAERGWLTHYSHGGGLSEQYLPSGACVYGTQANFFFERERRLN